LECAVQEHAKQITHDEQVALYFKSVFCLVIPGDSQVGSHCPLFKEFVNFL
jgi:hypothetical protein